MYCTALLGRVGGAIVNVHCFSKRAHFVFAHNFDKCQPIFIVFSNIYYRKFAKRRYIISRPNASYGTVLLCKMLIAILVIFFTAKNCQKLLFWQYLSSIFFDDDSTMMMMMTINSFYDTLVKFGVVGKQLYLYTKFTKNDQYQKRQRTNNTPWCKIASFESTVVVTSRNSLASYILHTLADQRDSKLGHLDGASSLLHRRLLGGFVAQYFLCPLPDLGILSYHRLRRNVGNSAGKALDGADTAGRAHGRRISPRAAAAACLQFTAGQYHTARCEGKRCRIRR